MNLSDIILIAAAAWYWSYVLTKSNGPGNLFGRLREWRKGIWHGRQTIVLYSKVDLGGYGGSPAIEEAKEIKPISGLLDCPLCLSIWIAVVFVLAPVGWLTYASAVAGAAMLLHGQTGWRFE